MQERLLDFDPATGVKTWHSYDESEDRTVLRYEQDCAPILDRNKAAQADGFDRRADMWHAASVPTTVLMEWVTKHNCKFWDKNDAPKVRRLLNSDEYRWLRVKHFII